MRTNCRVTKQPSGENYCDKCGKAFSGEIRPCFDDYDESRQQLEEFTSAVPEPTLLKEVDGDESPENLEEFTTAVTKR